MFGIFWKYISGSDLSFIQLKLDSMQCGESNLKNS